MQEISAEDMQWAENALQHLANKDLNAAMEEISSRHVSEELQPIKVHLLGLLSIRMENFAEALNLFKRASDASPMSKIHFEAASYCATKLGMLSDSVFYLKMSGTCPEVSEFETKLLPSWMGTVEDQLARIQERPFLQKAKETLAQQKYPETLQNLQQALNADPFHVESWLVIHEVMQRLDRKFDSVHAVKAALDSGDVKAVPIAQAALTACKLGIAEYKELFSKAFEKQDEFDRNKVELCELEALRGLPYQYDVYKEKKLNYLKALGNAAISDKVVSLVKQVNIGIFSGRLNSGQGVDFFVNFILDMFSFRPVSWLAIQIFSNVDYGDFQTNRLRSYAKDYRPVEQIDPITLSRILSNERIHLLWDLDGLTHTGAPQIHQETTLPHRLVLDEFSDKKMLSLVGGQKYPLEILPLGFPKNFDPASFVVKKGKERKTILLSLNPCELSDKLFDMLEKLKKETPFFDLLLDTRKLGGVSYVEKIEEKFRDRNLGNFITFNEVGEFAEEYITELYGKADYLLTNSNVDALQSIYHGLIHNCNILIYEDGVARLVESSLEQLGLKNRYFDQLCDLGEILRSELMDDDQFVQTLEQQNSMLSEYVSVDQRVQNVQTFVEFIKDRLCETYGEEYMKATFGKGSEA
ncbi:hypothetical protein [Curvivirga sp.]|uniref:hypothetical protein n=1 Tax=Curvivirga sp. TaxID=2856848 RepID=UPI003B593A9B